MRPAWLLFAACVACGGAADSNAGTPSCSQADAAWQEALEKAKACNPLVGANECTELVVSSWHCGCKTFAGATNQSAIQDLVGLEAELQAQAPAECKGPCAGDCADPVSGACQFVEGMGGAMGHCEDVY